MTSNELHWLAGWLEGEGSFRIQSYPREIRNRGALTVRSGCTDKDVVDRVCHLVGGHMWLEKRPPPHKNMYRWHLTSSAAAGLMMTLFPLMGDRRKEQIKSALAIWRVIVPPGKRPRNDKGQFLPALGMP